MDDGRDNGNVLIDSTMALGAIDVIGSRAALAEGQAIQT